MYLEILFSIYKARTECIFKIFLQRTYFWRPGFLSRSILRRLRHRKFVPYRPVCPATWPRRTSWYRGRGRQTALVHSWRQSSPGPRHHTQQRRPKHNKDGTGICFQNNNKSSFSVQVMFESIFWKSYSGLHHFQQIHLQRGFIILLKFEGCGIYNCIFSFTHLDETVLKTLITHLSAAHGCGPESNPKLMNNHSLTDALPANCRLKGPLNYGGNWALYW